MSCFYSIWDIVDDTVRFYSPLARSLALLQVDPPSPLPLSPTNSPPPETDAFPTRPWSGAKLARKMHTSDASEFADVCGCFPSRVWGTDTLPPPLPPTYLSTPPPHRPRSPVACPRSCAKR